MKLTARLKAITQKYQTLLVDGSELMRPEIYDSNMCIIGDFLSSNEDEINGLTEEKPQTAKIIALDGSVTVKYGKCSVCDNVFADTMTGHIFNYCPYCGHKIVGRL